MWRATIVLARRAKKAEPNSANRREAELRLATDAEGLPDRPPLWGRTVATDGYANLSSMGSGQR
jgi:hypothetical protein